MCDTARVIRKAKRILVKRPELAHYSDKPAEQIGVLASEAGYPAKILEHLLSNGVDTREKLEALRDQYLLDQKSYLSLSEGVRSGAVNW